MDLSIVIPTFNRYSSLEKTLQSIVAQEIDDWLFEVIVVDNGSTDETLTVCRNAGASITNFVYCYDAEPGLLTGRHRGTKLSKGNIISFIDDDVELNPQWMTSILQLFNEKPAVSIIGGPCLPKYHIYPPQWTSYFWRPTPYGGSMCLPLSLIDVARESLELDPVFIFGLNYSIRKKVLLELGGFHPDCIPQHLQKFQGDGETGLSIKARTRNIKAWYAASAFLYHQVTAERLTTAYFEKWHYYNGICQSFSDLRAAFKLDPSRVKGDDFAEAGIRQLVDRIGNKIGNKVKRAIKKSKPFLSDDIIQLESLFNSRYFEGYNFHQLLFKTDDTIKAWVLRDDYWDYRLPTQC